MLKKICTSLWVLFFVSYSACFGQAKTIVKKTTAAPVKKDPCPATIFLKTAKDIPSDPVYTTKDESIFWVSPSAAPGDKVLVKGAFTETGKQVEIELLQNENDRKFSGAITADAVSMGSTGISFEIPKVLPKGVYIFRIGRNNKLIGTINKPVIYWTESIGEKVAPDEVAPGDSLVIVGTNFPDKGYVLLKGKNHLTIPYTAEAFGKKITINIPSSITAQKCSLQVCTQKTLNAAASENYGIGIVLNKSLPIKKIVCSKLIGNGITDNIALLQDYLKETSAQYRLYFEIPEGTFLFSKQLILQPNQYLVGTGQKKTILKAGAPDALVPDEWIKASSHFGLMQLTIEAPVKGSLISNYEDAADKSSLLPLEDVVIKNASLICSSHSDSFNTKVASTNLMRVAGKNIIIVNCVFNNVQRKSSRPFPKYTDNVAVRVYPLNGSLIKNNRFELGDWGLAMYIIGYQNTLVEKNAITGETKNPGAACGFSIGISTILDYSRNILILDNDFVNITGNNRESITTDFSAGTYLGMVKFADSKTVSLLSTPSWSFRKQSFTPGNYIATIIAGKGVGQYRYIQSEEGNTITVDEPWQVMPDSSSAISITLSQKNVQIIHNNVYNSGRLQFYGNVLNGEISYNHLSSSLGIMLHSAIYMCSCVPLQNISISSNEFTGNTVLSPKDKMGMIVRSNYNGAISGVVINKNRSVSDSADITFMMNVNRIKPALIYNNEKESFRLQLPVIKGKTSNIQAKESGLEKGISVYQ
ncbi:MAG: glycosyl hydrolase family 28-related protein [Arachidicoccus sp.]|nr:glycosyl hydrolase family 28-related protein [Arachidicoccus sp.]